VILSALLGLALGVWLAFPWRSLAEAALIRLMGRAAESGVAISLIDPDVRGVFPRFVASGVDVQMPFFSLVLRDLSLEPLWTDSLSERGASLRLVAGEGGIFLPDGTKASFSSLSAGLFLKGGVLTLSDLDVQGDIQAAGSLRGGSDGLLASDLTLKLPPSFDGPMRALGMMGPVRREGDVWRIEKHVQ
jgi:hypothetical protein